MTTISKTITKRLQLSRESVYNCHPASTHKWQSFLAIHFTYLHQNNLNQQEALEFLKILHQTAKKIARASEIYKNLKTNNISDTTISSSEIQQEIQNRLNKLEYHAKEMKKILDNNPIPIGIREINKTVKLHLTPYGTAKEEVIERSLTTRLASLINSIERYKKKERNKIKYDQNNALSHTQSKEKEPKKRPYRLRLLLTLAEAWEIITTKPIEKLKRDRKTDQPYGKFYEFIYKALENFCIPINPEEAIKDINKHYVRKLELSNN